MLTVDPNHRNSCLGSRTRALSQYKRDGVCLWIRATDKATLFYSDNGQRRQRTWNGITLKRGE